MKKMPYEPIWGCRVGAGARARVEKAAEIEGVREEIRQRDFGKSFQQTSTAAVRDFAQKKTSRILGRDAREKRRRHNQAESQTQNGARDNHPNVKGVIDAGKGGKNADKSTAAGTGGEKRGKAEDSTNTTQGR